LAAAQFAKGFIGLPVGLFHRNPSLSNAGTTSNAAVSPVMPAPMMATDFIFAPLLEATVLTQIYQNPTADQG